MVTHLGLREHEVDNGQYNPQPATVHNVVLPAKVSKADRIDELVEKAGALDCADEERHAFSPDWESEDLDGVSDRQGVPGGT